MENHQKVLSSSMIDQARWKTVKAWTKAMAVRLEIMGWFPDGEGFHEGSERSS